MLATWNGAKFLGQQLESLDNQTVPQIDLWVSDDGSTDGTLQLLGEVQKEWTKGKFEVLHHARVTSNLANTPTSGANENFRSLILNSAIKGDYFAFCDQDDIWDKDKLERAYNWLSKQPDDQPCLYCTRTRIIDSEENVTGLSPLFRKTPTFSNAVVQNIAAGNTIVLNKTAMELLRGATVNSDFVSHDWWSYIVVAAFGGKVKYDHVPSLSYRQHENNLIGENASWKARMTRMRLVFEGRFKSWNNRNRLALSSIEPLLPQETKQFLVSFDAFRSKRGLSAIWKLKSLNIYRQTRFGQIGLYFASFIGKI